MAKESELITVSSKGQIVIPKTLRQEIGIKPKTKLLVYGKKDTIIIKKIKMPEAYKVWGDVFDVMERKHLKLTSKDVQKEIEAYRTEKRLKMKR